MKTKLTSLVRWFCLKLTYNDLASVVVILHDVLSGSRKDIALKPEEKSPNYRSFRVDTVPPLRDAPGLSEVPPGQDWQALVLEYNKTHRRNLQPVGRRGGAEPPQGLSPAPALRPASGRADGHCACSWHTGGDSRGRSECDRHPGWTLQSGQSAVHAEQQRITEP